jgi:hypothetical protein
MTALAHVAGAVLRFWLGMLSPALQKTQLSQDLGGEPRVIKIEDPFIVKVPGLQTLTGVSIDGVRLPLVEDRPFQQCRPDKEPETTYEKMVMVELRYSEEEGAHLIRSEFSNDGRWQVGSTLVVAGEWDDNPESFASSIDLEEKDAEIAKLKKENAALKKAKQGSK